MSMRAARFIGYYFWDNMDFSENVKVPDSEVFSTFQQGQPEFCEAPSQT